MAHLQTRILSHTQKVCRFYKRAARNTESYCKDRIDIRYNLVLLRHRFDVNKDIQDIRLSNNLLIKGEEELFMGQHPIPKKFAYSPGGVAYERVVIAPDWVLDYWDPIEKAEYPQYFALREKRKKEYLQAWEKKHGSADPASH